MLIKFTYVDAITGVPMNESPCANGPTLPTGASIDFSNESQWPCDYPIFYGHGEIAPGVIDVLTQADYDSALAQETEQRAVRAEIERKARIPQSVTMRQARLALLAAGLLDAVESAILTAGTAAKIEWEYAQEVQRNAGLIPKMAQALGMTDAQIDDLFVAAAAL